MFKINFICKENILSINAIKPIEAIGDPLAHPFIQFIPLRAEQGGINFTPFVLSLPYAKKKKKKKKLISHMDEGWLKNVCLFCLSVVCLLSVVCCLLSVCLSQVCPQLSFEPLVQLGQKNFYTN
jgi:hypothetical protein